MKRLKNVVFSFGVRDGAFFFTYNYHSIQRGDIIWFFSRVAYPFLKDVKAVIAKLYR